MYSWMHRAADVWKERCSWQLAVLTLLSWAFHDKGSSKWLVMVSWSWNINKIALFSSLHAWVGGMCLKMLVDGSPLHTYCWGKFVLWDLENSSCKVYGQISQGIVPCNTFSVSWSYFVLKCYCIFKICVGFRAVKSRRQ